MDNKAIRLSAAGIEAVPFEIPGAQGEFRIQVLNEDTARGVVTTIVHLPPGGVIPAHFHEAGSEMHYVLEGDLVEAGEVLGTGGFVTHAAGQVHGPHESHGGAQVLTVQHWQSEGGAFDFHPAERSAPAGGGASGAATSANNPPASDAPATDSEMDAGRDKANDAPPPGMPDIDEQAGERGEAKGYS